VSSPLHGVLPGHITQGCVLAQCTMLSTPQEGANRPETDLFAGPAGHLICWAGQHGS
jgi:hypothetical protein